MWNYKILIVMIIYNKCIQWIILIMKIFFIHCLFYVNNNKYNSELLLLLYVIKNCYLFVFIKRIRISTIRDFIIKNLLNIIFVINSPALKKFFE